MIHNDQMFGLWLLSKSWQSLSSSNCCPVSICFNISNQWENYLYELNPIIHQFCPLSLPQSRQSVSGSSKILSCTDYSGQVPSAGSVCDTTDATYLWSVSQKEPKRNITALELVAGKKIIFYYLLNYKFYTTTTVRLSLTSTGSTSTPRPSRFFLTVVTSSLAKYAVCSSCSFSRRSSSFLVSLRMCYKRSERRNQHSFCKIQMFFLW